MHFWAANQPLASVRQALLCVLVLGLRGGLSSDETVVIDGTASGATRNSIDRR